MSPVIKRYFVAEGEKAEAVAEEGLRLATESHNAGLSLAKEFGAVGTFGRRPGPPYALVWKDGEVPEQNKGFLPPEPRHEGEARYQVCKPDKRTTVGKELLAKLNALPRFDFSDYACKAFGVEHSTVGGHAASRTGLAMYHSVAGYMSGKLLFVIPFGGDQGGGKVIDVAIPAEFREITAGEYMTITASATESEAQS